jgi:hypothetical protein
VAPAAAPVQAGPEQGGGGQEEEILALGYSREVIKQLLN